MHAVYTYKFLMMSKINVHISHEDNLNICAFLTLSTCIS